MVQYMSDCISYLIGLEFFYFGGRITQAEEYRTCIITSDIGAALNSYLCMRNFARTCLPALVVGPKPDRDTDNVY